jgi:Na+-transporting NADH:ubiquinone oxidoreductase subunit B
MATEPVTTPRSPNGRAIFGIFVGIFTMLFRLVGSLTGGVATAILLVSLFGGSIDRISSKLRMHRTNYRSILGYLVIAIIMIALSFYVVMKVKI